MLVSVFDSMRKSGICTAELRDICALALKRSPAEGRRDLARPTIVSIAALVFDAWHRKRRYLDVDGEPRAIRLLGPSPSVEALVRHTDAHDRPSAVARELNACGLLVRKSGHLYKPADRTAFITGLDPAVQNQYIARASATLLRTIRHNVACGRESLRLIERVAEVPDLPQRKATEFKRFARAQGAEFLRTLNDWLESRRARRVSVRRSRNVRAGIHIYAYVERSRSRSASRT
jgi:hypothetical protein